MQNELYEQYLQLLAEIEGVITQLNEVEKRKIDAVHKDDLLAVDECIRQEQAISLTMRSLESRRRKQLTELGLSEVKLSGLAAAFPADLRHRRQWRPSVCKTPTTITIAFPQQPATLWNAACGRLTA